MRNKKTRRLAVGGLMAALIAALTAYVRISIPGGYLNPGDAAVAMAGVLLGPYAAIPAAVGSGLADLLGYPQYAIFTFIIKGCMGLIVGWGCKSGKLNLKSLLSLLAADVALVGGYFLTDLLLGDIGMAVEDLPWNALQAAILLVAGIACLVTGLKRVMQKIGEA